MGREEFQPTSLFAYVVLADKAEALWREYFSVVLTKMKWNGPGNWIIIFPKYHDYDRIQELFLRSLFSLKKKKGAK